MPPSNVSVTSPISPAIDHVKRLLFRPFEAGKWFVIGFCAWLAHLGEGGFGGNYNFGSWNGRGNRSGREQFERVKDYLLDNLHWIVPLVIGVVLIALALFVLFTWLSSRGRFMFLHCVALEKAEVAVPWRKFAREANSLFLFRLALGLIAVVPILLLSGLIGMTVFRMVARDEASVGGVLGAIALGLALAAVGIVFGVIAKFTTDFAVPIMFLRGCKCMEGWKELIGLLSANVGRFILYLLFQIVLAMAVGAIVLIVVIATCCLAGCLLAIPYLGTVVLLPILIFDRSYSLYYLAQYGREFNVFPALAPPAPGITPQSPSGPPPPVAPV
jgi:hypothetical protein